VIATFNGGKYINEQLTSILKQLDDNAEVIISDDGSTDDTFKKIKELNDQRIRIYTNSKKKGVIANFENALNKTTGDIVFLSDQDDVWLDNKVEIMKAYLKEFDLVMTDCEIVDQNLALLQNSFYEQKKAGKGLLKNIVSNTYQGCNMAFRRELLKVALPFPKKIPMHDLWLGFIAELFFSPHFIPNKLLLYRRHQENVSTSGSKSNFGLVKKIVLRLQLLSYVPLLVKRRFLK
jgi:glycosyltransferase involved in cell wall biosynthesis